MISANYGCGFSTNEAREWVLGLAENERTSSPSLSAPKNHPSRQLIPNGAELFLPMLPPKSKCLITVEGVYEFWRLFYGWVRADAAYICAPDGRFALPYDGVRLDRKQQPMKLYCEDRESHRYGFVVSTGTQPARPSLTLVCPGRIPLGDDGRISSLGPWRSIRGSLEVSLRVSAAEERRQVEHHPIAGQGHQKSVRWVEEQIRRYADFAHYADEGFLRDLATKHTAELIASRDATLEDWNAFHADPARIAMLTEKSPATYERARYRVRALAIAEQLAVRPPAEDKAPAPQLSPPCKPTHEEWLERNLRHRRNKATDAIARAREKLAVVVTLDELGLDPDERERYLAEIDEAFADAEPNEGAFNAKKL